MKQDYNRDPHDEITIMRVDDVRRAVQRTMDVLSRTLLETVDDVSKISGTLTDPYEHIREELDATAQQVARTWTPVAVESAVIVGNDGNNISSAQEQMVAEARQAAASMADQSVDFMTILNNAQQDQKHAA